VAEAARLSEQGLDTISFIIATAPPMGPIAGLTGTCDRWPSKSMLYGRLRVM